MHGFGIVNGQNPLTFHIWTTNYWIWMKHLIFKVFHFADEMFFTAFMVKCIILLPHQTLFFAQYVLLLHSGRSPVSFYTPPHDSGGYYGFMLVVLVSLHLSVHLSYIHLYFRFRTITWVNVNGFSPNLLCELILWRPSLGLLMGKLSKFLTELSAHDTSIFSFQDNNLAKFQQIFTKLDMCIDIVKIWFGIAFSYISSILNSYLSKTP